MIILRFRSLYAIRFVSSVTVTYHRSIGCKSRVIRVEANESLVKRSSERLCGWSRGRFASIDPRYGSPRFSPEAPRCRQTAVGIRDAIALFNQELRSRGRRYCQRIRAAGKRRWVQRAQKNRAIGPPRRRAERGYIPFRLLQNVPNR